MKNRPLDPFQAAVAHFTKPWGQKTRVGKIINKKQQHVSAIAHGKTMGNEKDRRKIAKFFGFEYDDFINFGKNILSNGSNNQIKESSEKYGSLFKHREWARRVNILMLDIEDDPDCRKLIEDSLIKMAAQIKALEKKDDK